MIDIRPVAYVVGLLIMALGAFMVFPLLVDYGFGSDNWRAFLLCSIVCLVVGGATSLASVNGTGRAITVRQVFILTALVWTALPFFGALPLVLGVPELSVTDAIFESVSGMTTTGTTVMSDLDALPRGVNLWRAILQWLGGLGIVIIAMLFLPVMKVGGMQFFRSEGFDTLGKVMPRALDISAALLQVYLWLTVSCAVVYFMLGMGGFDAICHALTTVSTGGFSTKDSSFTYFNNATHYAAVVFMLLGSLPFIRFIQLGQGSFQPFLRDSQARAYVRWTGYAVALVVVYHLLSAPSSDSVEAIVREALFNVVSIFSGTGFTNENIGGFAPFPFVILIIVGLIGGCTASTGCSVKVFRYLILFAAIKDQVMRLSNPSAITTLRYEGRSVGQDVVDSVIVFFTFFLLSLGVLAVALSLTGLEFKTAITAAWTSLCNIGPVFGPEVGATGAVDGFSSASKWLMIAGMIVGRLELLSVYVLLLRRFWRD